MQMKSKMAHNRKIMVIRAEERLLDQFKEIALKEGYPYCELVRVILRKFVEEKGYPIK
jgi:predicted DNA binding CopG/RHH family protein